MKTRSLVCWLSVVGAIAASMGGTASAADIHVMISAGFYGVYSELAPAFERASGHHLITTRGPSMGNSPEAIPARLAQGETADVAILDGGAADALGRRGLLRPDSKVNLARSLIGMVVREGAARPDIGSVEAFRRTLLAAKSIAYSDSGSGTYLSTKLFPSLGVADEIAGKSRKVRGPPSGEPVGGCRAWRIRDRLPAGQRADPCSRHYFRRDDSGRGPADDLFRGRADHDGPATRGGRRLDPLSLLIGSGARDPEGRSAATSGKIARINRFISNLPGASGTCRNP